MYQDHLRQVLVPMEALVVVVDLQDQEMLATIILQKDFLAVLLQMHNLLAVAVVVQALLQ
jgi:hypothetical protein